MNKELKRREHEKIQEWIKRIVPLCLNCDRKEMDDILREICRQSYISGVHDTKDIEQNNENRRING